jgi:hypothetical protein
MGERFGATIDRVGLHALIAHLRLTCPTAPAVMPSFAFAPNK